MSSLTKLQKITLLLTFYTAPWGAAKGATWEFFVDDKMPFEEESVLTIMSRIINGIDEKYVDWSALEDFFNITVKVVAEVSETEAANVGDTGA
jgi:hypothetical protein